MSENETVVPSENVEKPSKLKKVGSTALTVGVYVAPIAITAASGYFGFKILKMNHETAKLQLEAARAAIK
jgi:hypothetical protein